MPREIENLEEFAFNAQTLLNKRCKMSFTSREKDHVINILP